MDYTKLTTQQLLDTLAILAETSNTYFAKQDYAFFAHNCAQVMEITFELLIRLIRNKANTPELVDENIRVITQNALWSGNIERLAEIFKILKFSKDYIATFMLVNDLGFAKQPESS